MRKLDARLDVDKPNGENQSPVNGSTCAAPGRFAPTVEFQSCDIFATPSTQSDPLQAAQCLQRRTWVDTRADANFEGSRAVSAVQFDSEIGWDGNSLTVWATVNGSRVFCENSSIYYSWSAALKRRDFVGDFTGSCSNF